MMNQCKVKNQQQITAIQIFVLIPFIRDIVICSSDFASIKKTFFISLSDYDYRRRYVR